MERELCVTCTGSYTGEFSPKWKGPWAKYFSAAGEFLAVDASDILEREKQLAARTNRANELRAANRLPLGEMTARW